MEEKQFNTMVNGFEIMMNEFGRMNQQFKKIDERFEKMDEQFKKIDERFEKMDERFEKMDERFEKMDERFEKIDEQFEKTNEKIDKLNKETNDRIDNLRTWASGEMRFIKEDIGDIKTILKRMDDKLILNDQQHTAMFKLMEDGFKQNNESIEKMQKTYINM